MKKLVIVLLALCASSTAVLAQRVKICTADGSYCITVTLPAKGCKVVQSYKVCKR